MNQEQVGENHSKRNSILDTNVKHPKFSSRDSSPVLFKNFQPLARKLSPAINGSPGIKPKILDYSMSSQTKDNPLSRRSSKERLGNISRGNLMASTRVPKTSIGKTVKNYLDKKMNQKQQMSMSNLPAVQTHQ